MLIILDRDGTINADPHGYISRPEDWQALPGSLEAIKILVHAGHQVVVASNQSGIGRGYFTTHDLQHIHNKMQSQLAAMGARLHAIYYCPHHPLDQCACRKPGSAMIKQILRETKHTAAQTVIVGDSLCDINAAINSGCQPILVRTGKGRDSEAQLKKIGQEIATFDNLYAASQTLKYLSLPS